MAHLRFSRRMKIAPGLTLNLSKSGGSLSFGPRGAKYTIGLRGRRTTVGIPGTGLFYTSTSSGSRKTSHHPLSAQHKSNCVEYCGLAAVVGANYHCILGQVNLSALDATKTADEYLQYSHFTTLHAEASVSWQHASRAGLRRCTHFLPFAHESARLRTVLQW